MRKEMIIRVQTNSEKGHCKAIKVAAAVHGVESVTITGEDKNLLLVIGVGIDSNRITEKLRRKVGHAEVVELRTVDAAADELGGLVSADHAYRYHPSPSPYNHQQHAAVARDHYYGGAGGYPRDHYYTGGGSTYAPQVAPRDYYYGGGASGGGGGAYPAQHDYYPHYPAAANTHTVVHHEYASDPNNCSVM
ncbi:disease resistance protein RGA5-like [Phragmites australis]|uniref:disease resistance protein RGA5-like n=1 Tax=Phragmites australis TaxID=29695 RepID=UPI002D78EE1E|nr:disease resistance protein RGA5-like [Phragmites australis]